MVATAITLIVLNLIGMAYLVLRSFGTGYGTKKGGNAADREDLPELTRIVEDIKHQNAQLLESLKSHNQLRVAAIDKRLQAHQEAFTLWRKLVGVLWNGDVNSVVEECQRWWDENCLYLEPEARNAFSIAYFLAPSVRQDVGGMRNHGTGHTPTMEARHQEIMRAGDVLVQAVQLPGLTQAEERSMKQTKELKAGEGAENG